MNTTPDQILDINDALVSDENPARENGTLDYERCARLHNYIVACGWMAHHGQYTPDLDAIASRRWYSGMDDEHIQATRERLTSPLISFLDLIYESEQEFFYWVEGLSIQSCDDSFLAEDNELEDEGKSRFIVIYLTHVDFGSHCLGVVYDQQLHRASFPMTIENCESVEPVDEHDDLWFPLETILTNWIHMIDLGKVVPGLYVPDGSDYPTSRSQTGLWSWLPYCDAQVDSTIATMERYSAAVESRMPPDSLLSISAPLFTDADLDAAAVPQDCFIRSLLTRLKTPRFKFIAPGLEVPHDKEAFARRQKFAHIPSEKDSIPGVLLFAAPDRTVNLNHEIRWLFNTAHENFTMNDGDPVPTGLYSEPTCRSNSDSEEAGFRLLLPFALRPDYSDQAARTSDGGLVAAGSFTQLFQHGFHPFGGEWRSQRLERLFQRWTELIEAGVWIVGPEGVEGGIDKFRDADNGNDAWMDYCIAPYW
ncbi:uncharacterized protein N7483_008744 [Penicillium malachiteum]|uniref:uncharacterized protein n=1 Tax=Penicillium malachiteum TaxID=1324776 RepID=UPI0025483BB1|nr:uncharacterized protein N7483_008744 [Penicillium malachiteum]KAJ5720810.1 hypothetical protein N7483_008744 [Penicillium malachiteum]